MKWRSFVFLSVTFFMLLLDFSIVNVALPAIQSAFAIPISSAQWVVSTYAIALAGFLMLAGRCSDLYDRRAIFMIGLALFTVASFVGGIAPTETILIVMRAVQGIGAAIVTPSAMAMLMEIFPEGPERSRALGLWNTIGSAGIAAGMLVGGVLVQLFDWRAVFFVNVPVGIVILILTPFVLPKDARTRVKSSLDVLGAVLLTGGLVLSIFTIESIADRSIDADTWIELVSAIALLAAFVVAERRARAPLVPASIFAYRNMIAGTLNTFVEVGAYASAFIFASVFAQRIDHYTPLQTGLAFLPSSILLTTVAGPLSAPLVQRIGVRGLGAIGGIVLVGGCALLFAMQPGASYLTSLLPATILIGMGGMWTYQVGMMAALAKVGSDAQGVASGVINTSVQAGSSIGVALAAALSDALGIHAAFAVAAALALATFCTAAFALRSIAEGDRPHMHLIPLGKGIAHLPRRS